MRQSRATTRWRCRARYIPRRLRETRAKIAPFVPIFISKRGCSSIPTTCQALRRALRDFSSLDTKGASRGRESLPSQMRTRGSERSGDLPEVTPLASRKAGLTPKPVAAALALRRGSQARNFRVENVRLDTGESQTEKSHPSIQGGRLRGHSVLTTWSLIL